MKILGLDLGTNSIGWAIRNANLSENQIEKFGVITFEKGVGEGKTGEYSFAAERTTNRSLRRRYQAHKYKLWSTLETLIKQDYCPLSISDLDGWRKYKKGKGRIYPLDALEFNSWIKLDFDGDGKPDYTSPYQLRLQLISEKLDFTKAECRYKLGRALYHIAQHRAFKSSKKVPEGEEISSDDLIGAEKKRAQFIEDLLFKHGVTTVGAAFAMEEKAGIRIRQNLHQHVVRKQLQQEVKQIFEFQSLSFVELFGKEINKSSIFWQRPLRSQKGTIGKCTLEPSKYRCPVSHPNFEAFRGWSFLNTIEYRVKDDKESRWHKIPLELRKLLYEEKFFRISKPDFDFFEIRKRIEEKNQHNKWELNYKDNTNVSACPVSARLQDIFGDDWEKLNVNTYCNADKKVGKGYYDIEDVWHVLFSFDDEDQVRGFASQKLSLSGKEEEKFVHLWYKMPVAYGMLSLNAINKILAFLRKGFIYTEAVLLAKMPQMLGADFWSKNEEHIIGYIGQVIEINRKEKKKLATANGLIAKYKALENNLKFAERDFNYLLQQDDLKEIEEACKESYGLHSWQETPEDERKIILSDVEKSYQSFFSDATRGFKKLPHLLDTVKGILADTFEIDEKKLDSLYHPSQIEIYPPAKEKYYEEYNKHLRLLESPKTGAFKNPMAMRTLYELRKLINYLLITEQIDEETRIVVELARDLNDSNMRWAIETYQRRRQEENKEFANAISELANNYSGTKADPNSDSDVDKFRLWFEQLNDEDVNDGKSEYSKHEWSNTRSQVYKQVSAAKEMIEKYRLWKQQQGQCIYTGRMIGISDLFSENNIDFEHTLPRSISFDNSHANLTVCDFVYNRTVKKNAIPTALPNYDKDYTVNGRHYTAIKPRLKKWEQKVEELRQHIEFWRRKSKGAATKEQKDKAIRQRHLWQLELNYWQNKLSRFTMTEVKTGFKNSQLVDTQLISKYAFHFLKTAFYKVEVQKGTNTAQFRKIFGIQHKDVVKDRSRHSHHAKDAAVLTLIPAAARREEILKKAYEYEEATFKQYTEAPYKGFRQSFVEKIEDVVLINNIQKDQALTPGKRRVRIRGKIVYLKDEAGNKTEKWAQGDSIRGQLHLDTFYGKIKLVKRDAAGSPLKEEDGTWMYTEKNEGFAFVVRKEINKDLKVDGIVDPYIKGLFIQQMNGRSLDKTLKDDGAIWMLNKNGERIHAMRHVRTFANDVTEPLAVKRQLNASGAEHKRYYWAKNGENYAYVLYQGIIKNKIERSFVLINLYDASVMKQLNSDKLEVEKEIVFNKKGDRIQLYAVLKTKQKVLFFKDDPEELNDLAVEDLSNRLYKIIKFEKDGRIVFGHHLDARNDNALKALEDQYGKSIYNGFSSVNYEQPWPKLKLSLGNLNCLIENKDFDVLEDGTLKIYS
jgi:CRISPR-associated endonuclease Csn1